MKALPFHIPKTEQASMHAQTDCMPYFYDIFHRHPEFQITYIEKSRGTLVLTDEMEDFEPGDIFIIGPNQPHLFKNDAAYYENNVPNSACAISIFFEINTFGTHFLDLPENRELSALLTNTPPVRRYTAQQTTEIRELVFDLVERSPTWKLLGLLELLHQLTSLTADRILVSPQTHMAKDTDYRINRVIELAIKEYHRPISVNEAAALTNMTMTSFCRYFKRRTRKSFVSFLNEVRVREASKLLKRSEIPINQIAYQVGFGNLSNFNRAFKRITSMNPTTYRTMIMHTK